MKKKKVAVVLLKPGMKKGRVVRRFNTIRQGEKWVDGLKSPNAIKNVLLGYYGIDG
jgi:hypothetical protein